MGTAAAAAAAQDTAALLQQQQRCCCSRRSTATAAAAYSTATAAVAVTALLVQLERDPTRSHAIYAIPRDPRDPTRSTRSTRSVRDPTRSHAIRDPTRSAITDRRISLGLTGELPPNLEETTLPFSEMGMSALVHKGVGWVVLTLGVAPYSLIQRGTSRSRESQARSVGVARASRGRSASARFHYRWGGGQANWLKPQPRHFFWIFWPARLQALA